MISLVVLVVFITLALAVAGVALVTERERRSVLDRATSGAWTQNQSSVVLTGGAQAPALTTRLAELLPRSWVEGKAIELKLVQAGYDTPTAPVTYAAMRLVSFVLVPSLVWLTAPRDSFTKLLVFVLGSALFAYVMPVAFLDRKVRVRQERIRRQTPDALDLLVVSIEAGVSLDAAILRVARELQSVHPDLSYEFLVVNRKTNAGVPREEALRGLSERTGVDDLRALVSSMIQSEKWGTSISTVLRVNAETLRRKRRQLAEKRAAQAPIKMTFPLVILILPAMFIVLIGPTALAAAKMMSK